MEKRRSGTCVVTNNGRSRRSCGFVPNSVPPFELSLGRLLRMTVFKCSKISVCLIILIATTDGASKGTNEKPRQKPLCFR